MILNLEQLEEDFITCALIDKKKIQDLITTAQHWKSNHKDEVKKKRHLHQQYGELLRALRSQLKRQRNPEQLSSILLDIERIVDQNPYDLLERYE